MSESLVPLRQRRLGQLGPLAVISVGIILSFAWVAVLAWLVICILGGFI